MPVVQFLCVQAGRAVEAVQVRQYDHSALLIVREPASVLRGHDSRYGNWPSTYTSEYV